jgi:hypothetical protein
MSKQNEQIILLFCEKLLLMKYFCEKFGLLGILRWQVIVFGQFFCGFFPDWTGQELRML